MTAANSVPVNDGPSARNVVDARRAFGATDLRVSPLGIGCARIGGVFQGGPDAFVDLVRAALDAGINFFDTADMYSGGESESILGRAFKGRRDGVVIASKVGYVLPAQRRLAGRIKPFLGPVIRFLGLRRDKLPSAVRGKPSQNFSPAYIRRAVEGSLARLRTDRIDLLQLHSPPAEVIRRGDWALALEALKREGKIRYWGIACDTAEDALAALEQPGVASVQVTVNLLERSSVNTVLPMARDRGVAVIARECLYNGLLAKEPSQIDRSLFRSPEEASSRLRELDFHRENARRHGVALPVAAIKYALAHDAVSTALIGVRTKAQLAGALGWFGAPDVPRAVLDATP